MRSANLGRLEHRPFRIVPEPGQAPENDVESSNSDRCDILQEDVFGSYTANDPLEFEPQAAAVAFLDAFAFAGVTDVLAREAARNQADMASPGFRVESCDIRPHWRIIQGIVLHTRDQDFTGKRFDLHVAPAASAWASKPDSKVKGPRTGEQADVIADGR